MTLQTTQAASSSVVDTTYEAWAPHYEEWNSIDSYSVTGVEHTVASKVLDALPPGRVLDAACGTGRWAKHMAANGWEAWMVDQSIAMLHNSRKPLQSPSAAHAVLADVRALPFPCASFDLVICSFALLHVAELSIAARELGRVTAVGGIVMISDIDPSLQSEWGAAKTIQINGLNYPFPCFHHSVNKYLLAASAADLELVAKYRLKALIDDQAKQAVIIFFFQRKEGARTVYAP